MILSKRTRVMLIGDSVEWSFSLTKKTAAICPYINDYVLQKLKGLFKRLPHFMKCFQTRYKGLKRTMLSESSGNSWVQQSDAYTLKEQELTFFNKYSDTCW